MRNDLLLRMVEGFYGNFRGTSMPNYYKKAVPLKPSP
jgi:hypothetical protein